MFLSLSFPLLNACHGQRASPLQLLPALHLPAAPEERRRQRACGPLPPPHLAIDIPERVPYPIRWPQHTCGACVNVGTDFWSVLVCTVAHCDVAYMDVYVVSGLTLDGTLVCECCFPSPSLC